MNMRLCLCKLTQTTTHGYTLKLCRLPTDAQKGGKASVYEGLLA